MRKRIKNIFISTLAAIAVLPVFIFPTNASTVKEPVSPALYVLANEYSMAKATLVGRDLLFTVDDFRRSTNLSKIDSITITKLPPITDGELRLGNKVLTDQTTISVNNLDLLTYSQSSANINTTTFEFRVNSSPVDIPCKLYFLDKYNECPTLKEATDMSLEVSAQSNSAFFGTLPFSDPDNDKAFVEIVSYPKHGLLILTNKEKGTYTYIPSKNFSGTEEFSYVARDIYGNYSASAKVSLIIK